MKVMEAPRLRSMAALVIVGVVVSGDAFAQGFAGVGFGGGGGYGAEVLQWFVGHIVQTLIGAAIIIGGLSMMAREHRNAGIAVVIIGMIIVTHWQEIANLFPAAG